MQKMKFFIALLFSFSSITAMEQNNFKNLEAVHKHMKQNGQSKITLSFHTIKNLHLQQKRQKREVLELEQESLKRRRYETELRNRNRENFNFAHRYQQIQTEIWNELLSCISCGMWQPQK